MPTDISLCSTNKRPNLASRQHFQNAPKKLNLLFENVFINVVQTDAKN